MAIIFILSCVLIGPLVTALSDMGVSECSNQSIRLINMTTTDSGTPNFFQYCLHGEWRTVCRVPNNIHWSRREALVACRQLGYTGAEQGSACATNSTDKFVGFKTSCGGSENSIEECGGVEEVENCTCDEDARIAQATLQCSPFECDDGEVRLVGGSSNREGRVEVCMNRRWGTVCNNSQEEIAGAVCSQLGFPAEGARSGSTFFRTGPLINNCIIQDESGTLNCTIITDGSCDHSMDLGVECRSYQEIVELSINRTISENCPVPTIGSEAASPMLPDAGNSEQRGDIITVLGAGIGVLVALLAATLTGWIVSCCVMQRKQSTTLNTSPASPSTHKNESYSLRELDNQLYETTQPSYSSVGQKYDTVTTNNEEIDTYDVIDRSQSTNKPANPTPVGDDTNKKGDDFYDAEQHTYSSVYKKKSKKTSPENGEEDKKEKEEDEYSKLKH